MKRTILFFLVIIFVFFIFTSYAQDTEEGINLNTATKEQLMSVPGMTEDVAEGILERREEWGEFVDIMELLDVDGVDPGLLRQFQNSFYVEGVAGCDC